MTRDAPLQRDSGVALQPLPERSEPLPQTPPLPGFPRHPLHLHGAAPPPLPLARAAPRLLPLHHHRVPSPEPLGAADSWRTVKPRRRQRPGWERCALWKRVSGALGGGRRAGN